MKPLWAIQTNLNSLDPALLADACRSVGLEVFEFEARTGLDLPDAPVDRPVLFYGSTFLVQTALSSNRWNPCAYFDEQQFRYSRYLAEYGPRMLNDDAEMTTLQELASRSIPSTDHLFIRPDSDLKPFAGALWPFAMFLKFVERVKEGGDEAAMKMPVFVAPRKQIGHEWRLFVVDQRVSSGSHYRFMGDTDIVSDVPDEVVSFANEIAAIWSPARAFVLDIASVGTELRLVELNGLHSCSFYAADVTRIVADISEPMVSAK
jgi:ATP-grasp domain-containing protein